MTKMEIRELAERIFKAVTGYEPDRRVGADEKALVRIELELESCQLV